MSYIYDHPQSALHGGIKMVIKNAWMMKSLPRHPSIPILIRSKESIIRPFHYSSKVSATAHPATAYGPPPKAPVPTPGFERVGRRKKQGRSIKQGKEVQTQSSTLGTALKRRFWKDVHVKKTQDGYQVLLDSRPVRTPTKTILTVPSTKPHLADAIALEWDLLTSAKQALKHHLIPLTSLTSRANDISLQDAQGQAEIRDEILKTAMRYLDTDTLLCWAPEKVLEDGKEKPRATLRDMQMEIAQSIITFLTKALWPGIEITPALDANSIMPTPQPENTKNIIRNWISSLPPYELAALEKGVLAGKSLLVAIRLVVEWSEHFRHLQQGGQRRFGIEEAAEASSLEVRWQTGVWGEVEDTHDVDKEDLKRQLGSVVLLVSGET